MAILNSGYSTVLDVKDIDTFHISQCQWYWCNMLKLGELDGRAFWAPSLSISL